MERDRAAAVAEAVRLMRAEALSANKAAEKVGSGLGVTGRTVKLWAEKAGTPLGALSREAGKTGAATVALQGYTTARRLVLCDKLLAAVEFRLADVEADCPEPRDLQRLAMTFAIASDKRNLLEQQTAEQAAHADLAYWVWQAEHRYQFGDDAGPVLHADAFHRLRAVAEAFQRWRREQEAARYDDDEGEEEDGDDEGDEPVSPPAVRGMSDTELMAALRAQAAELRAEFRRPASQPEPIRPPAPEAEAPPPAAPEPRLPDIPGVRWVDP